MTLSLLLCVNMFTCRVFVVVFCYFFLGGEDGGRGLKKHPVYDIVGRYS